MDQPTIDTISQQESFMKLLNSTSVGRRNGMALCQRMSSLASGLTISAGSARSDYARTFSVSAELALEEAGRGCT
jgi:hypothetical protein